VNNVDERELVSRCQAGDLSAFDNLMQQYEKKVYSLCFRMTGRPDDAADLAQDAFLKAYRAIHAFKGQSSFSTWLFRIVTNTCLDERRRRGRRPSVFSLDRPLETKDGELALTLPDNSPDPLAAVVQSELQAEIQRLLNMLPADQKMVLILRDLEGYSYDEIAAALNITLGTVKSRLNRARSRLRELYLKKEELFDDTRHLNKKGGCST
jgi:RNA polymerase sigma-70 factor (ECF subfamily)